MCVLYAICIHCLKWLWLSTCGYQFHIFIFLFLSLLLPAQTSLWPHSQYGPWFPICLITIFSFSFLSFHITQLQSLSSVFAWPVNWSDDEHIRIPPILLYHTYVYLWTIARNSPPADAMRAKVGVFGCYRRKILPVSVFSYMVRFVLGRC